MTRISLLPLAGLLLIAPAAVAQRTAIELTADRSALRSDGKSRTTVTARVYVGQNPVPDGTRILFTTTAGRLDSDSATTRGGIARVTLTAADQPSTARITANLETPGQAVPADLTIPFASDVEDEVTSARRPWVRIKASEFVGYAIGVGPSRSRLVGAFSKTGVSILTAGDLTIGANEMQLDADRWIVRVAGNVVLWRGKLSRNYAALYYEINTGRGLAQRLDGTYVRVEGRDLIETDAPDANVALFKIVDQGVADVTIECREIALEQGGTGRILMSKAKLYVGGQRVASLPYHTMTASQRTLFREQLIGAGPAGLTLDLPVYFDVRPSAIGTLHIRRGAQFGSSIYASRSGWNLDLDQAYERGSGQGLFQVLNLTGREHGLRWQHAERLGALTDASFFVDAPTTRDVFGTVQLGHSFRSFRANVFTNGSYSTPRDEPGGTNTLRSGGDTRTQLLLETYPRIVPGVKWLRMTLNATAAQQRFYGARATTINSATTQTVGGRWLTTPFTLAPSLTLTQSLLVGQTWNQGIGVSGVSVQGTTALVRTIQNLGSIQLNYDYLQHPPFTAFSTNILGSPRHRLGLAADLTNEQGWNFSIYGTRGLDVSQTNLSGNITAPLGMGLEVQTRLSFTEFGSIRYREVEYALLRRLDSGRSVGVYYSTTTRRVQFDLTGGLRF